MSGVPEGSGYVMPQASGGDWFSNVLNFAGAAHVVTEQRKSQDAQARQQALIRQDELRNQQQYSEQAKPTNNGKQVEAQWISGVSNQTVLIAGGVILVSAFLMK